MHRVFLPEMELREPQGSSAKIREERPVSFRSKSDNILVDVGSEEPAVSRD